MTELLANSLESKKNFIPIREAAKRVSYTPDYVARLAREKKIIAQRSGRVWYVDLDSLKLFSLQAKADAIRKQEALKIQRRQERAAIHTEKISIRSELKVLDRTLPQLAVLQTVVVMVCLVISVSLTEAVVRSDVLSASRLYSQTVSLAQIQPLMASVWYANIWPDWLWLWRVESREITTSINSGDNVEILDNEVPRDSASADAILVPQISSSTETIVLAIQGTDDVGEAPIKEHFSDNVTVGFTDTRHGTITANFSSTSVEVYPFVIRDVPVQEDTN